MIPSAGARLAAAGLALAALAALASGCGSDRPPPAAVRRELAPRWQDVFDGTPELLVLVRPQAIKRDGVYGNLFKSAMRVALSRSAMAGITGVEVLEAVDEVIVGVHKDVETDADDAAIVYRGVPASLDPLKLVDERGAPLFRQVDERAGKVTEYAPEGPRAARDTALFTLPDRTWVLASGGARTRARQAFATPSERPAPKLDVGALAVLRLGSEIVGTPRYQKSPVFGPLVRRIAAATLLLDPGNAGLRLVLTYEDDDATAWSEMHARRIAEQLAKTDAKRFGWMSGATVTREGRAVTIRLPVPARLLEELPNASGADLPL